MRIDRCGSAGARHRNLNEFCHEQPNMICSEICRASSPRSVPRHASGLWSYNFRPIIFPPQWLSVADIDGKEDFRMQNKIWTSVGWVAALVVTAGLYVAAIAFAKWERANAPAFLRPSALEALSHA